MSEVFLKFGMSFSGWANIFVTIGMPLADLRVFFSFLLELLKVKRWSCGNYSEEKCRKFFESLKNLVAY